MLRALKHRIARFNNFHRPGAGTEGRDVFLFSTPRGGSTWLAELILTQPGFKPSDEPFNLRDAEIAAELRRRGILAWPDLYDPAKSEAMFEYVESIRSGQNGVTNPFFYRNHFRVFTNRVCFKILHGGEDRIPLFRRRFGGAIVLLLRHPVPVALSRKQLPRLSAFHTGHFRALLTPEQLAFSEKILASGSDLEKGVLDWCLQTAVPLASAEPEWTIVTYEQLVLEPHLILPLLAERLALPRPERLRRRLTTPSSSTHQSDRLTRERLSSSREGDSRLWLVEKWRERTVLSDVERAMEALSIFGLARIYRADTAVALAYWIQDAPQRA
jgi:hypothetical protein